PASIKSATNGKKIFFNIFGFSTNRKQREKNCRHHNIANGQGKWSTHVNSSPCPKTDHLSAFLCL
ncbi:hypothetical protein ACA369_25715, partial [Enterobacter kobei]|uniref:hypothetical protein n=1 Tax=Enterobacter kobei TaxID=208224 RepID=UPI003BA1BA15